MRRRGVDGAAAHVAGGPSVALSFVPPPHVAVLPGTIVGPASLGVPSGVAVATSRLAVPASRPACERVNMSAAPSLRARHVPLLEPPQSAHVTCSVSSSAVAVGGCPSGDGWHS